MTLLNEMEFLKYNFPIDMIFPRASVILYVFQLQIKFDFQEFLYFETGKFGYFSNFDQTACKLGVLSYYNVQPS